MHNPLAAPATLGLWHDLPVTDPEEPQYHAGKAVPRAEQQHHGIGSSRSPVWQQQWPGQRAGVQLHVEKPF